MTRCLDRGLRTNGIDERALIEDRRHESELQDLCPPVVLVRNPQLIRDPRCLWSEALNSPRFRPPVIPGKNLDKKAETNPVPSP